MAQAPTLSRPEPAPDPPPNLRAAGVVSFYNFLTPGNGLREDVLAGLAAAPKTLGPRWFFNEAGMRIHRALAAQPAWYQDRTEAALVKVHLDELTALIGAQPQLVEIGPGAGSARQVLVARLAPALHVQVEADPVALTGAVRALAAACPWLNVCGILANPAEPLVLPQFVGLAIRRKVVFLPAATLAHFSPDQLYEVLRTARAMAGQGGGVLACVDFKKDHKQLGAAYNDPEGLAQFLNANVLARINDELGADFQPQRFTYRAGYDEMRGRMEMRLVSNAAQFVRLGEQRFDFAVGEPLLTGIASLYTAAEFAGLASDAGLKVDKLWVDDRQRMGLHWLSAA
jgi:dimethylhistidine N-methyltransferase